MTPQEEQSVAELPEAIKAFGNHAFERWKTNIERQAIDSNTITKNWLFETVFKDLIFARNAYYYKWHCKTKVTEEFVEPQFDQNLDYRLDHLIEKSDPDGNELSKIDRSRVGFVFLTQAIDWLNHEFEKLRGIRSTEDVLPITQSQNPWGLTNAQVVLMMQIGLFAAGLETDTQKRHIAGLTKLLHMLLEEETDDKLNASGYYGPFKAGMSGKEAWGTIEDLKKIKPVFEKFGHRKGTKLINERLRQEKNANK